MGDCSTRKDDLKCKVSEESAELKEKPWQLFLRMRGGLVRLEKGNLAFSRPGFLKFKSSCHLVSSLTLSA